MNLYYDSAENIRTRTVNVPSRMFDQRIVYLLLILRITGCDRGSAALAKLGAPPIHGALLQHYGFLLQRHASARTLIS